MRGSLQDQLLKSGIATEDQLKKNKPKPKHKPSGHRGKSGSKPNNYKTNKPKNSPQSPSKNARQDDVQNAHKNNQPNKKTVKKQAEAPTQSLGKALRTEIKQLLKTNKLNDKAGEIAYNYVIAGQVKRFYINEKQQTELKAGKLFIVNWNTISYLISTEAEQALRKLHPTIEVASASSADEPEKKKDADDPYADFEIPDDLSW